MNVLFASTYLEDTTTWVELLKPALPEANILVWRDDGVPVGADVAVCWAPPTNLLLREPGIRAVFNLGAGVDAVLKLPGLVPEMPVVRLEDAGMAAQMAEYAAYALVRASRQFPVYETLQKTSRWAPQPGIRRAQWPVGVLGMGVMGARVATVLSGLDYPVAGWSRSDKSLQGVQTFAGDEALDDFLARTRVLVNTLPLTPQTRDILNRRTLGRLLPGAYLINMGRGEHLVEEDLVPLLDEGRLLGATLDVFRQEPLPADHPFWQDARITITPHVAAASLREETVAQVAAKIRRFARGESMTGVVERGRGY